MHTHTRAHTHTHTHTHTHSCTDEIIPQVSNASSSEYSPLQPTEMDPQEGYMYMEKEDVRKLVQEGLINVTIYPCKNYPH